MTKTERIRGRIADQERVIEEHERKIVRENLKPTPNWGLIRHWRTEIQAAQKKIARLQRRLAAIRRRR